MFRGALAEHVFAPRPPAVFDEEWAAEVTRLVERHAHELAGDHRRAGRAGRGRHVVLRARVRAAAARAVRRARRSCWSSTRSRPASGAPATLFAAEHADVQPDVMCVGKALTGGYHDARRDAVHVATWRSAIDGPLMHGPTYMANPLATRGRARVDRPAGRRALARRRGADRARACAQVSSRRASVGDVRVLGAIGVIELDRPVDMAAATRDGGRARRVAAPVPRPDLRDAAVRDQRRGPGAHHRGDGGVRVLIVTGTDTGSARRSSRPRWPRSRLSAESASPSSSPRRPASSRTRRATSTRCAACPA